jgi:hypothetical protein
MKDTTTIVIAVGLVAGAFYLATREEKAADGEVDDGPSSLCGNVGTLDKKAGAACSILATLKNLLPESACTRNGGTWGAYTTKDGFTGSCHRYGGGIYASAAATFGPGPSRICCGRKDQPWDPRCSDVRAGTPRTCVDGFPRDPSSIRDHRTGAKT